MPDEQVPKVWRISTVVDFEDGTMLRVQVEHPESVGFRITDRLSGTDDRPFRVFPEIPTTALGVVPVYGLQMQAKGNYNTMVHFWYPEMGGE